MVRVIRNRLKQLGFEDVDAAADGSAALAKLRANRYGLVTSDWNMEPVTGYELPRRCTPTRRWARRRSSSKTENVIAAKKAGVDNYIVKRADVAAQDRRGLPGSRAAGRLD